MTLPKRESTLVKPVARYLRRKGIRWQKPELPFYERRIDLFGVSRDGEGSLTWAVELKLCRWRRALRQALIYQLCSDFVFIAMPGGAVDSVELSVLKQHGIGLIAVGSGGRCREVVPPQRSAATNRAYREEYITLVRGVS